MSITKNRSPNFRYVYCNGFGLQSGGNEVTIHFGFKEDPKEPDIDALNEVGIIMLPATLKLLARTLSKVIDIFEASAGMEIPWDESKMISLETALLEATQAQAKN